MSDVFEFATTKDPGGAKVQLRIENRVAHIVLNNPPLNMLSLEMMGAMSDAINQATREQNLCAIVFEPGPKCRAFSAGLAMEEHRPEVSYQMLEEFHGIFRNLDFYCKPTVAVVPDAALGAGCEIAAFCDVVIATERARFGLPEIKIGVFPPLACVYFPRIVGQKRAREMILTGALLSAREAKQIGLITHVVADDQLQAKTQEVLERFRALSAAVLETARRALVESAGVPFDEGLSKVEDIYLNQLMSLKDPGEGLIAFMEKRSPNWKHK
jgi:cyclohexa-1,5-dienecarbonyl-CoA hydratase